MELLAGAIQDPPAALSGDDSVVFVEHHVGPRVIVVLLSSPDLPTLSVDRGASLIEPVILDGAMPSGPPRVAPLLTWSLLVGSETARTDWSHRRLNWSGVTLGACCRERDRTALR